MPLDTSIPLQVQMPQFAEPVDPATRQYNAMRTQALQQEMMRNQLLMQNTMEDRRREEENRRVAAAQAANERRRLNEYRGILGNFGITPAVTGRRGMSYSGTGVPNDPYAPIQNELLRRGFVPQAEELAKLQKEQLAGEESKAKLPGFTAESREKGAKADKAEFANAFDQMSVLAPYIASGAMPARAAVDVLLKHPVAGKLLSSAMTPEQMMDFAEKNPQGVAQILATPPDKIYESLVAQPVGRTETVTDAAGNMLLLDKSTGVARPVTMAAPAGAPAGAPAAAGEPVKAAPKGGLTENQKMQLKSRTSDDFGMATETLRYVQDIERDIKDLTNADISGATGYQSYFPSFKANTIRAEKTLTEIRDKVGGLGRTLASMSGKLGNLAVQEYEYLRQQVALIDPVAGEEDVKRQLAKAEASMKRIANTVRDRYSREYGGEDNPFPQFRDLPKEIGAETKSGASTTTPSGVPVLNWD